MSTTLYFDLLFIGEEKTLPVIIVIIVANFTDVIIVNF